MRTPLIRALALLCAVFAATSEAQQPSRTPPPPSPARTKVFVAVPTVTLVLVNSLDVDSARAMLFRRALPARGENIILVTEATTPADLVKAIAILNSSRRSWGDVLQQERRAFVTKGNGRAAAKDRNFRRASSDLQRLRTAPVSQVKGVGSHRAVTSSLPRYGARPGSTGQ